MTTLLSVRSIEDFSPEEYHLFIKGQYKERVVRSAKKAKAVSWSRTKKGSLSLRINREGRFITREEIAEIVKESGFAESEVWLKVTGAKRPIRILSPE